MKTRVGSIIVHVARACASAWGKKTPFERERDLRRRAEDDEQLYKEQVRISETVNRVGLDLSAELDLGKLVQHLTDEATALSGAQFGAFFYNVVDVAGESYMLYALSGVPRDSIAGFKLPQKTELLGPTFGEEKPVRLADVTRDPRYGKSASHYGMSDGHPPVRSYLAVPVVSRSGETLGGLFFGHAGVGVFGERDERIVLGIAGQAAVALDNAKLFQQAKEAIEVRDQFVSMASHELNTPLTSLGLQLAILRRGVKDAALVAEKVEMMSRQVSRLTKLVNELLDVSRITTGNLKLELERCELAPMVREVALRLADDVAKSGSTLSLEVDESVSGTWDRLRLEQVVTNLLSNALKFGCGRPIDVSVQRVGGTARVSVRDRGIGIDESHQAKIFQRFERAVSDRSYGGFGLGLWIVRQIVEAHQGTIRVESRPGQGSTFAVDLPCDFDSAASVADRVS